MFYSIKRKTKANFPALPRVVPEGFRGCLLVHTTPKQGCRPCNQAVLLFSVPLPQPIYFLHVVGVVLDFRNKPKYEKELIYLFELTQRYHHLMQTQVLMKKGSLIEAGLTPRFKTSGKTKVRSETHTPQGHHWAKQLL